MKIILKQDVKSLGYKDDVVTVKNGYANNYLIPKGIATIATPSALKILAEDVKQAQFKQDKIRSNAEQLAGTMKDLKLTVGAKAGSNGRIFGSISSLQISQALKNQGYDVDKRKIVLDEDIKNLGQYQATLNLFKGIHVKIDVEVVAE